MNTNIGRIICSSSRTGRIITIGIYEYIVSILISLSIVVFVSICTLCGIKHKKKESMSTYGFGDFGCGEERASSPTLLKNLFSPVNIYHDFIFSCKSASAPGDLSTNAKTLCCTMFSDSEVPKTLLFTISSDSRVPRNGRVIRNWWKACRSSLLCL